MKESDSGQTEDIGKNDIFKQLKDLTPQERIAKHARGIAYIFELDDAAAGHLRGYGNIYLRIREIRTAFETSDEPVRKFPGWTGGLANRRIVITRENYMEHIGHLEDMADNIHAEYFYGSARGQYAARMMKELAQMDFFDPEE